MTKEKVNEMYKRNQSPKSKATKLIIASSQLGKTKLNLNPKAQRNIRDLLNNKLKQQTLATSLKTRDIIKNNFRAPRINNPKFLPVSKSQAKETIFRTISHDPEQAAALNSQTR